MGVGRDNPPAAAALSSALGARQFFADDGNGGVARLLQQQPNVELHHEHCRGRAEKGSQCTTSLRCSAQARARRWHAGCHINTHPTGVGACLQSPSSACLPGSACAARGRRPPRCRPRPQPTASLRRAGGRVGGGRAVMPGGLLPARAPPVALCPGEPCTHAAVQAAQKGAPQTTIAALKRATSRCLAMSARERGSPRTCVMDSWRMPRCARRSSAARQGQEGRRR